MNNKSAASAGIALECREDAFELSYDGLKLFRHTADSPMLFVGRGEETIDMYRGNFDIRDYVVERLPLRHAEIRQEGESVKIDLSLLSGTAVLIRLTAREEDGRLKIGFEAGDDRINRVWLRLHALPGEKVFGCGEQMSHFNLRGKHFPLWTSEPGVGRNKNTYVTWQADVLDKAGGDYYTTNYPQPTFVSSRKYICHVETTAYADFDFRRGEFHELQLWAVPDCVLIGTAPSFLKLAEKMSDWFGRQPELPEWTYNGIWLGIQGGTETVERKLRRALDKGVRVGGVWCQDWQGKRITSFGKRLMWNWQWNSDEYPGLDRKLKEWKQEGIRFLGYINPYVAVEGELFRIAKERGYLGLTESGDVYLVDFGEFLCGIVDFTNPEAFDWYKSVIKENLIGFGLDGWMADFGEYLPTDVVLHNGVSAKMMHNAWPVIWAKVNYEAVQETGKLGQVVFFMRAGYSGVQRYCPLLWAGDQSVDWTLDDGLASVIPAALSSGIVGNGLHHSDIGGYTSLYGNKRSKELFMRWAEMAAFTPVMRSHEGNRPDDCWQFDGDDETLEHLARMTNVYVELAPYTKELVKLNARQGIPLQRPLFMHDEENEAAYEQQYEYLYGPDLLVAPVYLPERETWSVYLPRGEWVHLWSGNRYGGRNTVEVEARLGHPPVFYRSGSAFEPLFQEIGKR